MRKNLLFLCGLLLTLWTAQTSAAELRVQGVTGLTNKVNSAVFTPNALFVAGAGGIQEFDRHSGRRLRTYSSLDGLSSLDVIKLTRGGPKQQGPLFAFTKSSRCELRGAAFSCKRFAGAPPALTSTTLNLERHSGSRVTVKSRSGKDELLGTASQGAFLNGERLNLGASLSDQHVTSLAVFQGTLWVGTFNGGLLRKGSNDSFELSSETGRLINALAVSRTKLFVGTSEGLYSTKDGEIFKKEGFIEGAVVGLAFDGTSIWATTPGALYRIRSGSGPPTDVWWMPGGSRSLQKISYRDGFLWIGTEDRGALRLKVTRRLVAKDKNFEIFNKAQGLASSWSLSTAALKGGAGLMTTLREGLELIRADGTSVPIPTVVSPWGLATLSEESGVWVGTQEGAVFLDLKNFSSTRIKGLPDERVHTFVREEQKNGKSRLWIGTEGGLAWLPLPAH